MELDLASQWILWFFGGCFAGGLVGLAVGKLLGFEAGLGVGLLLAGCVSLSYVPRFALDYLDFTRHPLRAKGFVVEIEGRPANADGDVTTPVAIVEYEAPGGGKRRAASRGGSGLDVGEEVVVAPDPSGPDGVKIGIPSERQGGAIAALLFGTFPFSAGIFFLVSALMGWREKRAAPAALRRAAERAQRPSRVVPVANLVMFAGFVGPIAWGSMVEDAPVLQAILLAFGLASLGMWIHVIDGVRMRRDPRWTFGVAVVALNFSVWSVALWTFIEPGTASW